MNTYEKAAALNALSPINIRMRNVLDWYVDQAVEVKNGPMLEGSFGNGMTPDDAIDEHWDVLVSKLPDDKWLVVNAADEWRRRDVRWNGFMWEDVK